MLKFNEEKQVASVNGALALRKDIEKIVDQVYHKGFDGIYFLGIGGTYASSMQVEVYLKGKSDLPVFVEHAAQFLATGNRRLTKNSIVIMSSVTGNTEEMVHAIASVKKIGACIIAFMDKPDTLLGAQADHLIVYPENEQLKFFMTADRFLYNNGDFEEYDSYYRELENHLATALVESEKQADDFGLAFAEKYRHDEIHYFIGAGSQWGAVYSYAMCYWEEQHWLRSKSIRADEFLHGTLEIIDEKTAVTLFIGEDEQRVLSERVANLLPRICANYTIIDSKDYPLTGISEGFRGRLSHLVSHAVTQRIDAHIELLNCHPVDIRRYYRQFDY